MKNGLTKNFKRLLAGLLAAGTALIFCACELPGGEINYGDKDKDTYHAHIVSPADIPVDVPEEKPDPGYKETYESAMMNFVVPNDFDKMEYFSREDFEAKNPSKEYSYDETLAVTEAYFSYMEELYDTGWQVKFNFICINNDNLPELVYASYSGDMSAAVSVEFHFCTYDLDAGEVIEIGSFCSQYGMSLFYVERENLLWYSEYNDYDSYLNTYFVTVNQDNKLELVASFKKDYLNYDSNSVAYVNNIETDSDTCSDYQDQFTYLNKERKEIESYSLNTLISLKGIYEYTYNEYEYENYYKQYEDDWLEAAYESYAEVLKEKADEVGYYFAFLDGDNIPEMFVKYDDSICLLRTSVYKGDEGFSRYSYEVGNSEFNGEISYVEYYRIICDKYTGNSNIINYSLFSGYDVVPMQSYLFTSDGIFYINGGPVKKERYEDFIGRWDEYTFTEISEDDFYYNKDEKNVKKNFYEAIKNYNP